MRNHPGELMAAVDQDGDIIALATTPEALNVLMADVPCVDMTPRSEEE